MVLTLEMQEKIKALFPNRKVFVLRNPVNVDEMRNEKRIARNKNRLLYLGWYNREKGVYELVDAIKILLEKGNKIELDFYGTKEVEKLRQYVKQKGLSREIRVNTWINDEKKLEALYGSTMLILPSHSEGLPNVVLEAMSTRTPVVSTSVGGLKELLRADENAIVAKPENPRDLSEKIEKCLMNENLRNYIAENAYKDIKSKYDLPVIRKEFLKILGGI